MQVQVTETCASTPSTQAKGGRMSDMTRGRRSISKRDRERFLDHIANGGTAREAARTTGRHHSTWYELAKTDDDFATAWKDAEDSGTRVLEGEAVRRAVEGYYVTRLDADGNVLWREHRHDNTLLTNVLKSRAPERWRENARLEIAGRDGGPVEIDSGYTPTTLRDVVALAGELGVLDALGFHRDEIEGETVDETLALTAGDDA